jgi:hypothetical protein
LGWRVQPSACSTGDEIDGAMQQAPHPGRQGIATGCSIRIG